MLPLSVPKLMGLQIYGVVSGSMEPEYSPGGVVYVRSCDASELREGDVITFRLGTDTDYVMTHRIVGTDTEKGIFLTKGDANNSVDPNPVKPDRVLGKVTGYVPWLAAPAVWLNRPAGIAAIIAVFAVAMICWLTADILKQGSKEEPGNMKAESVKPESMKSESVKPESMKPESIKPESMKPDGEGQQSHIKADRRGNLWTVRILALLLIAGGGCYLGSIFVHYHSGNREYEQLAEAVFSESEDMEEMAGQGNADNSVHNAIARLQEENPDTAGWIHFEDVDISYPVMQGEDNDYYLNHTFSGEQNSMGSIFLDTINHSDFTDSHTIIYGHNMKNLSMFGRLRKYKEKNFYKKHQYFWLYTAKEAYRYQIFSYYDVPEDSDIYTVWYTPDENFTAFVRRMKQHSYYDTEVEADAEDYIVTLSTCSTEGSRFVIHAKRAEEIK